MRGWYRSLLVAFAVSCSVQQEESPAAETVADETLDPTEVAVDAGEPAPDRVESAIARFLANGYDRHPPLDVGDYPQNEDAPSTPPEATTTLREQLQAGSIEGGLAVNRVRDGSERPNCGAPFSSSYLVPTDPPPDKRDPRLVMRNYPSGSAMLPYLVAFEAWACSHGPSRVQDGDTTTAWVEGVDGDGIGEVLVTVTVWGRDLPSPVHPARPVEIWAGHGASPERHAAHGRPQDVRVYVLRSVLMRGGDGAMRFEVVGVHEVTLEDVNAFQPLPLPAFDDRVVDTEPWGPGAGFHVALEILSVYAGSGLGTAISEIRNVP